MAIVSCMVDRRLWDEWHRNSKNLTARQLTTKNTDFGTYASKEKLGGNQGLPLVWIGCRHNLCRNRTDELTDAKKQLVRSNREAANLKGRNFGNVGDEATCCQANTKADEASGSQPGPPIMRENFCKRSCQQNNDGYVHGAS